MSGYKVGDIVKCRVSGITEYGIFVVTEDGYTGLIHISEISNQFVKNISDYAQVDDYLYAKVLEVIEEDKKMKLSIKKFDYRLDGIHSNKDGFATLKEHLSEWIEEYKNEHSM